MTRNQKILYYLLYATVLICVFKYTFWVTSNTLLGLELRSSNSVSGLILTGTFVNVLPGLILGLEQVLKERNKPGNWKLDWTRLIAFGVPALFLAVCHLFTQLPNIPLFLRYIPHLLWPISWPTVTWTFGGAVLGYALVSSFKKELVVSEDNIGGFEEPYKLVHYLIFTVVLFSIFIFAQGVTCRINFWVPVTYEPFTIGLMCLLMNTLPGLILGLEHVLRRRNQSGKWRADWTRLIILGIPSMYIQYTTWSFASIFLGYILATSINKEPIIVEDNLACNS